MCGYFATGPVCTGSVRFQPLRADRGSVQSHMDYYWSEAELTLLRQLAPLALSTKAIAKRVGRTVRAIQSQLFNLRLRQKRWRMNSQRRGRLERLFAEGWSKAEIARRMGTSPQSINSAVKRFGLTRVKSRNFGYRNRLHLRRILARYDARSLAGLRQENIRYRAAQEGFCGAECSADLAILRVLRRASGAYLSNAEIRLGTCVADYGWTQKLLNRLEKRRLVLVSGRWRKRYCWRAPMGAGED